jgi:hypothetical protein
VLDAVVTGRRGSRRSCRNSCGELELENMARTNGSEGSDRNTTRTQHRGRGKERRAHQEVSGVLREVGGGPERPDFAGIQGGRRGCASHCSRYWFDSFMADGDDDVPNSLEFSGMRAGDHGSGATVRWWR